LAVKLCVSGDFSILEHFLYAVLCWLCSRLFVFHNDSLFALLLVCLRVVWIVLRVLSNFIVLGIFLIEMQSYSQWNAWDKSSTGVNSWPDQKLMAFLPFWSSIVKVNTISVDSFSDHLFDSLYDGFVLRA
jgi:hypothetical protein